MIIVDSTVWIDYLQSRDTLHTVWLNDALERVPIGLTDLILCEVLQGMRTEKQAVLVRNELLGFHIFQTGGIDEATASAAYYRILRRKGITIRKTIACLIATFCIQGAHQLLHNDSDVRPFEKEFGLLVVHPQTH